MGFMAAFGQGLGGAAGSSVGGLFGDALGSLTNTRDLTNTVGVSTQSTKKVLSPEAINKLIYDVMSSDQGLAALASGENLSGGFNSSSKTLLAQDLVTKLVGELAVVTAETVQKGESNTSTSKKKKMSVICTELHRQGYIADSLYEAGQQHFQYFNPHLVAGYQLWAVAVARKMQTSPRLTSFFLPWVIAHYNQLTKGILSIRSITIRLIGYPICYILGLIVALVRKLDGEMEHYGRTIN